MVVKENGQLRIKKMPVSGYRHFSKPKKINFRRFSTEFDQQGTENELMCL